MVDMYFEVKKFFKRGYAARTTVIVGRLGANRSSVARALTRLRKEGYIGYQRPYWGLKK